MANCRYSLNNSTSYNQNGEAIQYLGELHCDKPLKDDEIVTFNCKTFFELANIQETVDLNNNFLFVYAKLRKTNFDLWTD